MKITTERRLELARRRLYREEAKVNTLLKLAAAEDAAEGIAAIPPAAKPKPKTSMVDDVIEHRAISLFGGDIYTPMIVREDRGESFSAECLNRPLAGGATLMAFLKCEKNRSWR